MRRSMLAFATVLAGSLLFAPAAAAVGPGGWDHVGGGPNPATPPFDGAVYALNADNPGVLYAGGNFTTVAGNHDARRIARWNGSNWSSLGTTPITNGAVFAIAYHAGKVYVGGTFQNAGGHANADFLAVWDGSTWGSPCVSTVPGPAITANVDALEIIGNTLYVGGSFANGAGIDAADYLVACDLTTGTAGSTVDSVGHAFGGAVQSLTADSNGTLYAGGGFINLESLTAADHVAAYIGGGVWQPMGSGAGPGGGAVDTFVRSLTSVGTDVYIGTDAVDVAGIAKADHVVRWDGSAWSAVGTNSAHTNGWFPTSTTIDALAHYGSILIAAGSFQNADGIATADQIAYSDGTKWRALGSDGAGNGPLNAHPVALAVSGGQVYAGGNFTVAGGDTSARDLASHALRLPDAAIGGTPTGHFVGRNVYSPSGAGEVRTMNIPRRSSDSAYLEIQNDGLVPASFRLNGTGGALGIAVHYFAGGNDVTAGVRNGTYVTGLVPPRGDLLVRLHVNVANSGAASATFTTTFRSSSGTPPDAVRAVVHAG